MVLQTEGIVCIELPCKDSQVILYQVYVNTIRLHQQQHNIQAKD